MSRDFTYIDDIINGIELVLDESPDTTEVEGKIPYRILNVGRNKPVQLMDFVSAIEQAINKKAILDYQPMQAGDVHQTWADVTKLIELTGYKPRTSIEEGVAAHTKWYLDYTKFKT